MPAGALIINTASVVAYTPPKILLDCSTTKTGIVAFTKALAKQQIEKGTTVKCCRAWTVLDRVAAVGWPAPGSNREIRLVRANRPSGQPVELAPVYVFLASQEASYVTGEVYGTMGENGTA